MQKNAWRIASLFPVNRTSVIVAAIIPRQCTPPSSRRLWRCVLHRRQLFDHFQRRPALRAFPRTQRHRHVLHSTTSNGRASVSGRWQNPNSASGFLRLLLHFTFRKGWRSRVCSHVLAPPASRIARSVASPPPVPPLASTDPSPNPPVRPGSPHSDLIDSASSQFPAYFGTLNYFCFPCKSLINYG